MTNPFAELNTGSDIFGTPAWQKSVGSTSTRVDSKVYRIKPDRMIKVRFLTDPTPYAFDPSLCLSSVADGSWVTYREVSAFGQDKNGPHMSNGTTLSHRFVPVADYTLNHLGERTNRGVRDPLQSLILPAAKELAREYPPMFAQARDMMLVNVVFEEGSFGNEKYDPEPGSVILLCLSPAQKLDLEKEYKTAVRYEEGFKFTKGVWSMFWHNPTGMPKGWALDLNREIEDFTPLSSTPDPIDGAELLRSIRRQCEAEAFATAVDSFDDSIEEAAADSIEAVEKFEMEVLAAAGKPARTQSIAYMKGKLREGKVAFPVRISDDEVVALFTELELASV